MCLIQQQVIEFFHNTSDAGNLKNNEAKGRDLKEGGVTCKEKKEAIPLVPELYHYVAANTISNKQTSALY
jgi:hypothetical protein